MKITLIRYNEIALKGRNKNSFINTLKENLSIATKTPKSKIKTKSGRIYLPYLEKSNLIKLQNVFGVSSFSTASVCYTNLDEIEKIAQEFISQEKPKSFKVESRRENKSFPKTSMEINAEIGEKILKKNPNLIVNIHAPETTIFIEIRGENAFIYTNKIQGPNGLPVGTSGNVLVLLSGGIDSPVALWRLLKRGMNADAIYFHTPPYTSEKAMEKVRELTKILAEWSPTPLTLYTSSITNILEEIKKNTPDPLTTIIQRRFMYYIATEIAQEKKYHSLATGEAIGQVASQTIENITATQDATNMPILRPLITMDKQEIIELAKKIGTYETSILPYKDSCHLFASKNPTTKASLKKVRNFEAKLNIKNLVKDAVSEIQIYNIS